jgi:hypothetical protein
LAPGKLVTRKDLSILAETRRFAKSRGYLDERQKASIPEADDYSAVREHPKFIVSQEELKNSVENLEASE